jgi:copper chaperone NosL
MKLAILIGGLALAALSCAPQPQPIEYGSDMCYFCKMSIVDNQHAAMAVTSKGKNYKFDAIECLLPFLQAEQGVEYAYLLVNDYEAPGAVLPAGESYYLISQGIPSPMGAFLSAFSSQERAEATQAEHGGTVYDWAGIQHRLSR